MSFPRFSNTFHEHSHSMKIWWSCHGYPMLYPHLITSHDTTERHQDTPRFAKTVAIALGIADQLQLPAIQIFGPTLAMLLGKDHSGLSVSIACVKKGPINKGAHTNCDFSMCSNHLKPIQFCFRCLFSFSVYSPIPMMTWLPIRIVP